MTAVARSRVDAEAIVDGKLRGNPERPVEIRFRVVLERLDPVASPQTQHPAPSRVVFRVNFIVCRQCDTRADDARERRGCHGLDDALSRIAARGNRQSHDREYRKSNHCCAFHDPLPPSDAGIHPLVIPARPSSSDERARGQFCASNATPEPQLAPTVTALEKRAASADSRSPQLAALAWSPARPSGGGGFDAETSAAKKSSRLSSGEFQASGWIHFDPSPLE